MTRKPQLVAFLLALVFMVHQLPIQSRAAVTISGDTDISSFEIQAGINGLGTLRIDAGSTQTTGILRLGTQQFGVGLATVTGAGSQLILNNSNFAEIGQSGLGRLEILNGGLVNMTGTSGSMRIGGGSGCCGGPSHGTVIVDGPGSLLTIGNDLIVGSNGTGTLQIQNGAIVSAVQSQTQVNAASRIEMNGGLLRINQLTNDGLVRGSGEISLGQISGTGRFEARSGQILRITGGNSFSNFGIIAADGGEVELQSHVFNSTNVSNAGEITLRNGAVRIGQSGIGGPLLQNSAVLAAIGGTNDFYGNIVNGTGGSIAVTNNSVLIFHDDVDADAGTITVFPGSSAVFLEDLTMTGTSVLLADLAGSGADTGFGEIEVVGAATLNSSLNVTLATGFTPQEGDSFPIVAASSISGALSLGDVADLPSGLKWSLEHEANRVLLSVVPGLSGDYNSDGRVDAGDYIIWRKTFGQQGSGLPADGNSNGEVDDGDYDFWRKRLGNTLSTGVGGDAGDAAVPEPGGAIIILAALGLVNCCHWKVN
jgi:T5SS/PEP-CTERM-associated repeat protein